MKSALEFQFELIDSKLDSTIGIKEDPPEIIDIEVRDLSQIKEMENNILSIRGVFEWRLLDEIKTTNSAFQIFLEQGERNESWRLARPVLSSKGELKGWETYPIPIS